MDIQSIDSFLAYWKRIRGRTLRVVGEIPPEHIEWTYREGKFTLGDLARHLAAIQRWMFIENACGRPSLYNSHGRELADGHDAVVAYMRRMDDESNALLRDLGNAGLTGLCTTPGGARLPVWKWLRAMVEHECHHRGQIHLYLSQLGIPTTPLYGLTAEEVEARSVSAP